MKNKIIIVGVSPLVQRRSDVFYIEPLRERGYTVEHCDLSPCFYNLQRYTNIIEAPYALTFNSLNEFEAYLKAQNIYNTVFVVELMRTKVLQPLFTLIKKYKCFCVRINPNASDMSLDTLPVWIGLKRGCYTIGNVIKRPIRLAIDFTKRKLIDNYDYEIWNKYISSGNNPIIDIHINQDDWVRSKKDIKRVENIPERYAVFCDQYFPYHPDNESFIMGDIDKLATEYYSLMNQYFEYLENEYKVRVVVAAHPKSDYKGNEFNGRPIVKFKTLELVRYADIVIQHSSMSISYAVIFDKPIALVITPGLKKYKEFYVPQVQYSEYFKLPLYDLSENIEARPQTVSEVVKQKYIYDYMTSPGIEEKENIDILDELFSQKIPVE